MQRESLCILLSLAITFFPKPLVAGPLDELNKGLQILNQLDQLRRNNSEGDARTGGDSGSQRRSDGVQFPAKKTSRQEWATIQARLNELGFDAGPVDGKPGRKTMNAIAEFQAANGLDVDGKIGPQTRAVLFAESVTGGQGVASQPPNEDSADSVAAGSFATGQPVIDADLVGIWEGTYVCGQGRTGARLVVTDNGQKIITPRFSFFPLPGKSNIRAGEYEYELEIDKNSGEISLNPYRWIERPYGIRMVPIVARYDVKTQTIRGLVKAKNCGEILLSRKSVGDQRAQSQIADENGLARKPADLRSAAIGGSWYAQLTCEGRGKKEQSMEMEFSISGRPDGNYESRMVINSGTSMTNGTAEFLHIGEKSAGTENEITFVPLKKIRSGIGQAGAARFFFNPITGEGRSSSEKCRPFHAERLAPTSNRLKLSVVPPADGGSYRVANSDREKCEVVIEWADRLNREYPDRDFYRSNRSGDDWRKIKLFADDDFVPVFGQSFDSMTLKRREAIAKQVKDKCYRNPFTKDRMDTFKSAADRALDDDPNNQLTSDGYSSTVFAIRTIRRIRNEFLVLETQANRTDSQGENINARIGELTRLKNEISLNEDRLWPSELAGTASRIDNTISTIAEAEVERQLDSISFEPFEILKTVEFFDRSEPEYLQYVSTQKRDHFRSELVALRESAAQTIFQRELREARSAPDTLEGAEEIEQTFEAKINSVPGFSSFDATGGFLSDASTRRELLKQFRNALTLETDRRISTVLDQDIAVMDQATVSFDGIETLSKLSADIDAKYAKFGSSEPVRAAKQRIEQRRDQVFSEMVNKELSFLDDLQPGKEGLARSSEWKSSFENNFGKYSNVKVIETAHEKYLTHREALLEASIASFETELGTLSEEVSVEAVDDMLVAYLNWTGDEQFPIAFEYQLLAESVK